MSGSTFTRKIIAVTFTLAQGQFEGGGNTLTVKGLKVYVQIVQVGTFASDYVSIKIWGLTQSQMNAMSTYSAGIGQASPNQIQVQAGDAESGLSVVYQGTIQTANADYSDQPNVFFDVVALVGYYQNAAKAPTLSYAGAADVATIMRNLASAYPDKPLTVENSGVSVSLSNPYFSGSIGDQIKSCAKAANINAVVDLPNGVLAIWPQGKSRNGQAVTIGPASGLIGYPTFGANAIFFRCLWNPNIIFGKQVQLQTSLQPANKLVTPFTITTTLQSEAPGPWFMDVECQILDGYTNAGSGFA